MNSTPPFKDAKPSYKILPGLSEIAPLYDAYILDVWGLLHDGRAPFPVSISSISN